MIQDLQSTFFEERSEKRKELSKGGGNGLCKAQGIRLVKNSVEKSKAGSWNCRSKSDSISHVPVINLCDGEDKIEKPMIIVEILDSDEEIEGRKADDTAEMPTETAKQVPIEDIHENYVERKDSLPAVRQKREQPKRRLPKRKMLKVPKRRIHRTRRKRILVRKRKVETTSLLGSSEVGPEDPSEVYSNVSDTPLDDDLLVEPISEHDVPESTRDSCNATPVLDEHPIHEDENTQCLDEQTDLGNSRVIFSTSFKGRHWKDFYSKDLEEHPPNGARVSVNHCDFEVTTVEAGRKEFGSENNEVLSESCEPCHNAESSIDKTCRANSSELNDSRECEKEEFEVAEEGKKVMVEKSAESSPRKAEVNIPEQEIKELSLEEKASEKDPEETVENMEVCKVVVPRVPEEVLPELSEELTPNESEKFVSEGFERFCKDLASEVPEEISAEVSENLPPSVPEKVNSDISKSPTSKVVEDLVSETPKDSAEDHTLETPKEHHSDALEELPSDAFEKIAREVSEEFTEDVAEVFSLEVSEDHTEDLSPEISEKIPRDVSEKLTEDVAEEHAPAVSKTIDREAPEKLIEDTAEEFIAEAYKKIHPEVPEKLTEDTAEKLAAEVSKMIDREVSEKLTEDTPEKLAPEVSKKIAREVSEKLTEDTAEKLAPEVSKKIAREVSEKLTEDTPEKLAPEVSKKIAREVSEKLTEDTPEKLALEVSEKTAREVSVKLTEDTTEKLAPVKSTQEDKPSNENTKVLVEKLEDRDKMDSENKYPEFSDISDNEMNVDEIDRADEELSEEVSLESGPTEETTVESTTHPNGEDDDEDDIPLKKLSSNKNEALRITYRLQRTRKYKPAGTYCEDSPLLYEEFFSNGEIFEDLPKETEPEPVETQQDFMKVMNLVPREIEPEEAEVNQEEEQEITNEDSPEDHAKNGSLDESEALPTIPIENGYASEDPEKIPTEEPPVQESNVSSALGNNEDDFKINKENSLISFCTKPSLEAPKLKILSPEALFCVEKPSSIQEEHLEKSKRKGFSYGKKIKRKRHKSFPIPSKNNILKPPFLKSALKSSNTPTSPIKRRVSFNLEVTEADTDDFFKCYRVRKRREDSSDESISGHSHKRKGGKESKKKKRHKRSPLYQSSAINDLDTEFQERFSQCLSIGDIPEDAEDDSKIESSKNSENIPEVAEENSSSQPETEDTNSSENVRSIEDNSLNSQEYDDFREASAEIGEGSEISTPEGADFMNEDENDDAGSIENVETSHNQDEDDKNEDDDVFAENDDPSNPIEFGDISGDIFVSSSSENEDDMEDRMEVSGRNGQKMIMMHVEVMLEKIIDSKKFCKQRGIKYISKQDYQDGKKKKSKKCKHKHKKRRKSRRESRDMPPEEEVLEDQMKIEKKCNETTEEELCEMSPAENNQSAEFAPAVVPVSEKSPGPIKLKLRSQEELMIPEMKQMQSIQQSIQQVDTLDLENVTRLDYHYLDNHYLFDSSEAHSNIKEDIEQTIQSLITLSEPDDFTNRSEYFEYDSGKSSNVKSTNSSKGSDQKTPYTEESPGVIGLLNDDMTMMTSVMPIDICPQKNGPIEMVRRQQQVVSMSDILAPKKATPEPPAECLSFYDSGSDKNITGESFCDENHSVRQDNSKMPGFSESPNEIRSSSPYVRVLSFDDIHMGKDMCDEPCDVLSKFHMTPPRQDNEFVTINKKDLADISSVSISPEIPQKNSTETLPTDKQQCQEVVQQVQEPDKSIDVSDESSSSWNSGGNSHEVAEASRKTVATEKPPEPPAQPKKPQDKPRPKVKSDKVTKIPPKEAQVFFPIKCNERIPVSKHTPIKNRSTATYSSSKTTIIRKSPSPARRTITSTREFREKPSHNLLDMPQLIDDDVEETERYPSKSFINKSYTPKRKPEEVPKSPGQPKMTGEELFDQLKKAELQTKLIGKIPLKRTESTSTELSKSSMNDIEVVSPLEAVTKQPETIHPPPAKIAKIHPQVVDKEESRRRKHGQVYRRDPFRNPEMTTSSLSPEMKARENLVKELGLSMGVDDSTLKVRLEHKLNELNALPTPLVYSEHKELKARKESLQKHLSILTARLGSSSFRSKPIALVPPSNTNRVKSPVASSSFDRFQADVSSSSSSSTPTKSRPQSSNRPHQNSWNPEHIPTEVIIATYQQKAKDKQSKRHHYVYT
ncbi:titin-like [Phlebotomus papatasi]|uniref:titin-like n=1 Tax=Phlebotomus papatasi TaxID=29031 RepID=UPI0024846CA5|nr:titin-like [Phlebotomus papatasi]